MDEDATTGNSSPAETFNPDLIRAIFKLVWRWWAEKGSGGNEDIDVEIIPRLLRRPLGETGVQLPTQARLKSAANFCAYSLQRLFNVLHLSLKRRMLPLSNPPI